MFPASWLGPVSLRALLLCCDTAEGGCLAQTPFFQATWSVGLKQEKGREQTASPEVLFARHGVARPSTGRPPDPTEPGFRWDCPSQRQVKDKQATKEGALRVSSAPSSSLALTPPAFEGQLSHKVKTRRINDYSSKKGSTLARKCPGP